MEKIRKIKASCAGKDFFFTSFELNLRNTVRSWHAFFFLCLSQMPEKKTNSDLQRINRIITQPKLQACRLDQTWQLAKQYYHAFRPKPLSRMVFREGWWDYSRSKFCPQKKHFADNLMCQQNISSEGTLVSVTWRTSCDGMIGALEKGNTCVLFLACSNNNKKIFWICFHKDVWILFYLFFVQVPV